MCKNFKYIFIKSTQTNIHHLAQNIWEGEVGMGESLCWSWFMPKKTKHITENKVLLFSFKLFLKIWTCYFDTIKLTSITNFLNIIL
jgi:hypothetical protein